MRRGRGVILDVLEHDDLTNPASTTPWVPHTNFISPTTLTPWIPHYFGEDKPFFVPGDNL